MTTRFKLPDTSKKVLLIIVVIAILAGFGLVVARSGPLAPIQVTVSKVTEADLTPTLFGIGTCLLYTSGRKYRGETLFFRPSVRQANRR